MADIESTARERGPSSRLRRWTAVAYVAYIAAASAVVVFATNSGRSTSIAGIGLAVPLVASGGVLARLAARHYPARMARYWRMFGAGCVVLATGLAIWSFAIVVSNDSLAIVASAIAVGAMPLFVGGLLGRIKTVGGVVGSRLDLLDLAIVVAVTGGYLGLFIAGPLTEQRGFAVSVLLCGGLVLSMAMLYALALLLRRGGSTVRRADRFMLIPFVSIAAYEILASIYLLNSSGTISPMLFVGAFIALAPLPYTPLMDSTSAVSEQSAEPIGERPSLVVAVALGALVPLVAIPTIQGTHELRAEIAVGVTVLVITGLIAIRQFIMLREIRHLGNQRVALAGLWKRDAARAEVLLGLLRRVAEGKDLEVVLGVALDAAIATTGAERAMFVIRIVGSSGSKVLASSGLSHEEVAEIEATGFDPAAVFRPFAGGRAAAFRGQPIPGLSDTSAEFATRSLAAVAVTGWDKGGLGAFCCDAGASDYEFSSDDLEMLEAIIDHVSLNLSQNRLFRELAASEERYRMLVEDATDGVCELDLDDRIIFTNAAFAELIGQPQSELPGRRLEEIIDVETDLVHGDAGVRELLATANRDDESVALEVRMSVRRDGRVQAVMRDVTERTRATARIEALYRDLGIKEQARTAALAQLIRATEDERSRVAADLHDGPVQALSTIAIRLDLAKAVLKRGHVTEAEEVLIDIRRQLSQEVVHIRHLMMELRPPVLDERGLFEAIENYAKTFELETGMPVAVSRSGEPHLDKPVETVLYRIMQEALTNVRKHAKATQVSVTLTGSEDGHTEMEVSDNGIGLDAARASASLTDGHIGLASMRERAELAGGDFTVVSDPGSGTTIRVDFGAAVMTNVGS